MKENMHRLSARTYPAVASILLAWILSAAPAVLLAQETPDMVLVAKETPITATVGEEDGEGLWVITADGTNYSVWTPEDVSFEDVSHFQSSYKNKEVTLTGDVFKDKYGNLNLFVKKLPK